ncbi:TonB-dependent siderophore receptor [Sinirhodobacter sp. WL0062]|uniref:TonB-dependent siderophore receptor n=1 Tax=Rhodobacter flavimaris TaxID=2907145 RepID=A0ABS8YYM6_9RHOB|nr:TonB-dependent siderophore receptor [Sinirhodobacter sp. WL0062]
MNFTSRGTTNRNQSLALATLAALGSASPALAQDTTQTGVILLPVLEVETSEPAQKPATASGTATASAATTTAAPTEAEAPAAAPSPVAGAGGLSPYADPQAGYKAVSSGNSLLNQPLSQTARTVNAVTAEVLADKNATSIRELARTTPGVTLGTGEGGNAFGDVLYIRGFKATNDTYIDGVRDSGAAIRETFQTEQVEITKGPSGSIAGRGTTGGAVNVITKKPQADDFTETETTVGTDGLLRQTIDWNKVWDERLSTRVNAMAQVGDVPGRDGVYDDRRGLSVAAEYKASDALTLELSAYHLEMNQQSDWGIPWIDGGPATETVGLDRDTWYGIADRDFQDGTQDIATFGASYAFDNGLKLSNRTRIGRSTIDYIASVPSSYDSTTGTVTTSMKSSYQVNRMLSNTTEGAFSLDTGPISHDFVIGFQVSREEIEQQAYSGLDSEDYGGLTGTTCSGVDLYNPDTSACWAAGAALPLSGNPRTTTVDTTSLYLTDTFKLSEQLTANLGARVDDYDITREGSGYSYARQDTMFNWNAGLTYKLNDQGMVYASIATSSNPMGQELDAGGGSYNGLDEAGQLLDPEENTAIEIGTKWEWEHLLFTAAAFQTTKDNARETTGRGAAAVTADSGKYRIRGVELGVAGKVAERLSLYGGAVLMNSEILESADSSAIGTRLANTAHQSFNLLAKYALDNRWTIGGQATWRGPMTLGTFAENGNKLPGYWRFDAMAEYELTQTTVLSARIDNLTDETYYDAAYRSGTPFVYVAPGRSASISLKMKF